MELHEALPTLPKFQRNPNPQDSKFPGLPQFPVTPNSCDPKFQQCPQNGEIPGDAKFPVTSPIPCDFLKFCFWGPPESPYSPPFRGPLVPCFGVPLVLIFRVPRSQFWDPPILPNSLQILTILGFQIPPFWGPLILLSLFGIPQIPPILGSPIPIFGDPLPPQFPPILGSPQFTPFPVLGIPNPLKSHLGVPLSPFGILNPSKNSPNFRTSVPIFGIPNLP